MYAVASCPASCGELIQGLIEKREMLISYPVNWHSRHSICRMEVKARINGYNILKLKEPLLPSCRNYKSTIYLWRILGLK